MALARPRDLVFTLFGDYLLHRPAPVWVGSILTLLEPLGVSNSAARTTLSRMSRKGWFSTHKEGRRSFYSLTPKGRRLLEEGEERIHHPQWDRPWDGRWLLVAYSVPEEDRSLRDRLRDRLLWLGFGSLGNGLWISPHPVADQVRETAEELGLAEHTEIFWSDHVGFSEPSRLVTRCWDLDAINGRYQQFIERHVPEFQACRGWLEEEAEGADALTPEACFVRRFRLVHEYREFPLLDPYLPESLLPDGWAGECASVLFETYHELLAAPADAYVDRRVQVPELAVHRAT
jgi:phenylacetic acid degradation operon negative regulatory protein